MSEIKLFNGAKVRTRDGLLGVVVSHYPNMPYPWGVSIDSTQMIKYYAENGVFNVDYIIHHLDIVEILNPEDAPDYKENDGWLPFSEKPSGNARELLVTRDCGEGSIRTVKFMYWHPDKDKSLLFDAEFCEEFDPEDQEKTLNRFGFRILAWKEKPLPYGG